MNNSIEKKKYSLFRVIIVSLVLLIIKNDGIMSYFSGNLKLVFLVMCTCLFFLISLKKDSNALISFLKFFIPFSIFLLFVYLAKILGGSFEHYRIFFNGIIYLSILFQICYYYLDNKNILEIKHITLIFLFDVIFTAFRSTFMLIKYPYISRFLSTGTYNDYLFGLDIKGVGNYAFFYSLVIIGILIFYLFLKEKRFILKIILFGFCLLCLYVLEKGAFTIAIFLLMFFIIKVFVEHKLNNSFFRFFLMGRLKVEFFVTIALFLSKTESLQ